MRFLIIAFLIISNLSFAQTDTKLIGKTNGFEITKVNGVYNINIKSVFNNKWSTIEFKEGFGYYKNLRNCSLKAIGNQNTGYVLELSEWYVQIELLDSKLFFEFIMKSNYDNSIKSKGISKQETLKLFGIKDDVVRI